MLARRARTPCTHRHRPTGAWGGLGECGAAILIDNSIIYSRRASKFRVYGGLCHPLPDARSVAGWIDGSDRPSCREAARTPPHCSLSPDLPDRENPAQILVESAPQWPDVICPYGHLRCAGKSQPWQTRLSVQELKVVTIEELLVRAREAGVNEVELQLTLQACGAASRGLSW